jgi:hypothetical protein
MMPLQLRELLTGIGLCILADIILLAIWPVSRLSPKWLRFWVILKAFHSAAPFAFSILVDLTDGTTFTFLAIWFVAWLVWLVLGIGFQLATLRRRSVEEPGLKLIQSYAFGLSMAFVMALGMNLSGWQPEFDHWLKIRKIVRPDPH